MRTCALTSCNLIFHGENISIWQRLIFFLYLKLLKLLSKVTYLLAFFPWHLSLLEGWLLGCYWHLQESSWYCLVLSPWPSWLQDILWWIWRKPSFMRKCFEVVSKSVRIYTFGRSTWIWMIIKKKFHYLVEWCPWPMSKIYWSLISWLTGKLRIPRFNCYVLNS